MIYVLTLEFTLLLIATFDPTFAQIYRLKGSSVVFTCKLNGGIVWSYSRTGSSPWTTYSSNSDIANVDVKDRLSITGDSSIGEYRLNIRDLQERDMGYYICRLGGGGDGDIEQLFVIVGPTNVQINNKISKNKLEGTEGQTVKIQCTATGGNPAPDVKILIEGNQVITGKQSVTYTILTLDKSHDGQNVTCLAGYTPINNFPLNDSVNLYLILKPVVPTYDKTSVSVIEGHTVEITCTSSGSRPATMFIWELGSVDISNSSQITSSILDRPSNTYTVISRLRFTLSKDHNGKILACKATNQAAPGGVTANGIIVNVTYPPIVRVEDKTFTEETSASVLTCKADGNPDTFTFYDWIHESLQGTFIRKLKGNSDGTLILPNVNYTLRYQNTGRYICTVGNGIPHTATRRTGSGVLTINAPPVILSEDQQIKLGQTKNDVQIHINVYSVPKYTSLSWLKGSLVLSPSTKYAMTDTPAVFNGTFHGTEVQVDGYRLTLTIHSLEKQDFVNYTLSLENSVGESVEHLTVLLSASPPDIPVRFIPIDATESSITLQWLPAYDGGHEQTFTVEYRKSGSTAWEEAKVTQSLHASKDDLQMYKLSSLHDGTLYEIRVYALNKYNQSKSTDIIKVSTLGKSQSCAVTDVAIGLSTLTVISLVINVVLALILLTGMKKSSTTKNSPLSRSVDRKSYPEVYCNIAEENNDKDQCSELEEGSYETLGTKDETSEYEGFDHRTRGDKECVGMKGENYETLGMKDKPNVYEELDQKPNDDKSKTYSNTLV